MKTKILSLTLCLIIILSFASCKKRELYAPGEAEYNYSSNTYSYEKPTSSDESSNISSDKTESENTKSEKTSSKKKVKKTWTPVNDGQESVQFGFKNKTKDYIVKIGYRPNGYSNYLYIEDDLNPKAMAAITLSNADYIKYAYWEFVFYTAYDEEIKLNPIKITKKKGINILSINGGYSYSYFK